MLSWSRLPFKLKHKYEFFNKASSWVSDVFYSNLPQYGYEIREEQIYAAHHILTAYVKRKKLFVEAGLGTGKTFAYLTGAVLYARFIGLPVVVSCASKSLVDQLIHPEGDIFRISKALNLKIDAQAALEPTEYLCKQKVNQLKYDNIRAQGLKKLLEWADTTTYGERSEVPHVPDKLWDMVAYEEGTRCRNCTLGSACPVPYARQRYRRAQDLIVCSHRSFFRSLRLKAISEQDDPSFLPKYAGVVFDEAHLVEDEARRALGDSITHHQVLHLLSQTVRNHSRTTLVKLMESAEKEANLMFETICVSRGTIGIRLAVPRTDQLVSCVNRFEQYVNKILDELSIDEGVQRYTSDRVWAGLQRLKLILHRIKDTQQAYVLWLEREMNSTELSLWVAPFDLVPIMNSEVLLDEVPVIFSSATLSRGSSFEYVTRSLGTHNADTVQVHSPYDYAKRCLVYFPISGSMHSNSYLAKDIAELLTLSNGRAMVLFRKYETLKSVRRSLQELWPIPPWTLLWEGDGAPAHLISRFRNEPTSVLFGVSFWEGVSVIGDSLIHSIFAELPFPSEQDPIVAMKRDRSIQTSQNAFDSVDVPDMLLRLKQGTGRVIRTSSDYGVISCLDTTFYGTPYERDVVNAFPQKAKTTCQVEDIRSFLSSFDAFSRIKT